MLSELLLQYHWKADQKRQEQQNHESWLLQGHGTGEGFQTRTQSPFLSSGLV